MAEAKKRGLLDNTIVILYGDHTIRMEKPYSDLRNSIPNSKRLKDDVVHLLDSNIPLVFYAPEMIKAGIDKRYCSQIDIAPSIMALAGITESVMFLGDSLFAKKMDNVVIDRYGIGRDKDGVFYGHNEKNNNFKEYFNLKSGKVTIPGNIFKKLYKKKKISDQIVKYNLNFYAE